jgi:hypothetical protein
MPHTRLLVLLVAAALGAGCLVEIEKVKDPTAAFAAARADAARVQGKAGRPGRLEVLVYDREEGQLVRASLPMWLVRQIEKSDDLEIDFDDEDREAAGKVSRHLRLEDLEKAARGVLVEVEEEDGDQVLVWLR